MDITWVSTKSLIKFLYIYKMNGTVVRRMGLFKYPNRIFIIKHKNKQYSNNQTQYISNCVGSSLENIHQIQQSQFSKGCGIVKDFVVFNLIYFERQCSIISRVLLLALPLPLVRPWVSFVISQLWTELCPLPHKFVCRRPNPHM